MEERSVVELSTVSQDLHQLSWDYGCSNLHFYKQLTSTNSVHLVKFLAVVPYFEYCCTDTINQIDIGADTDLLKQTFGRDITDPH